MAGDTKTILIVGAGRAGTALINIFKDKKEVKILAVVDRNEQAPGIALAKQLKIPTDTDWSGPIREKSLNEVIDATGNGQVHAELMKSKPDHVRMADDYMASALWFLAKEYEAVEEKIRKAKEEVEAHEWGVQKTNEAIKTLYKELEEKNKELQELDRLKSDFISTVSHELRTPLAITKEGIALILDGVLGHVNDKQVKVLNTSKDSIDRLSRLIASLLDISRIEAGSNEIEKSLVNIKEIAAQVASLFESKASDKGLPVRVTVPDGDIDIYADKDKIVQVFTNLINNAIKFTEKGHIEVGVVAQEDEVECYVEDTGKGVAKEDLGKLFVKFRQINREHGDGEQGTGLGLSIAKSIIEMHEGRIWAESEQGKGMRVTFTVPKYDEQVLLKEFVDKGLAEAKENNTKMSLMVVKIRNNGPKNEALSPEEMVKVLKGVDRVIKDNVDGSAGAALKESHECVVILPNSSKQNVFSAEGRLKQAVDDYLTGEKLFDRVELQFGCATYPDDAQTGDELIKLVSKN